MTDSPRRLLLRLGVKLMTLTAVILIGYTLLSSIKEGQPKPDSAATLRLKLTPDQGQPVSRIPWSGGNLILLWRSAETVAQLKLLDNRLLDPASRNARQPADLASPGRSRHPEFFLAHDRGTDMGCPLKWIAPGDRGAPYQPWPGGLRDTCRGSWYDAAGRVFKGQPAGRNLDIPPNTLLQPDLLEIGVTGDNPDPVD